jgi:hypothetical protein
LILDLREKLKKEENNIIFEFNKENSMPTQIYDQWFHLDKTTGIIRTRNANLNPEHQIDYEQFKEILLGIDVLDAKTEEFIENILIKINVNDLNDNVPVFDLKYNYEPSLNEDSNETMSQERLVTKVIQLVF